jgi:hypothetical protein
VSHVAVVIPLAEGARDRAVALLARGPQFDPAAAGLTRYEVFFTAGEAVFLFEAETQEAVEKFVADTGAWAGAWKELAAGPLRIAESAFTWERPESRDFVSSEPTPGPGDSEGGDVFPP